MRHYEESLRHYGLADDQYRRAVAAHELAHALVAMTLPSLTCSGVQVEDHPQHGVHGGTWIGPARRGGQMDPYERAVELEAGAIAKACWLKTKERRWTRQIEQLVYECAAGDRARLDTLGLTRSQRADAARDASHAVQHQWGALVAGVPRLVTHGRLVGSQLRSLARSGRPTGWRGWIGR
jgi:hypothetical protein